MKFFTALSVFQSLSVWQYCGMKPKEDMLHCLQHAHQLSAKGGGFRGKV